MLIKEYSITSQDVVNLKMILDALQEEHGAHDHGVRRLQYWIEDLEREAI